MFTMSRLYHIKSVLKYLRLTLERIRWGLQLVEMVAEAQDTTTAVPAEYYINHSSISHRSKCAFSESSNEAVFTNSHRKASQGFAREHRVDFQQGVGGWLIVKAVRLNASCLEFFFFFLQYIWASKSENLCNSYSSEGNQSEARIGYRTYREDCSIHGPSNLHPPSCYQEHFPSSWCRAHVPQRRSQPLWFLVKICLHSGVRAVLKHSSMLWQWPSYWGSGSCCHL